MQGYLVICGLFICFATGSPRISSNGGKIRSIPAVDALITRLEAERWKPGDEPCLRATLDMLWGVKNNTLWAMWVWDSMQPPVGSFYGAQAHLGNYDQCLNGPWSSTEYSRNSGLRTQYCLVDVERVAAEETRELGAFDDAEEYFRAPNKDRRFNQQFFGVCLPAICSASSVANISRHLHQVTHLPGGDVYVDPRDCQKAGEVVEYSTGFYMFWALVGALFITTVLSTCYTKADRKNTSLNSFTNLFCLKRNYSALFIVYRDEIKVMNGIRCITAALILIAHEAYYAILIPTINGLELDKMTKKGIGQAMAHVDLTVDTFFTMSGLLFIRSLMIGRQRNVFYILVKRYLRLIGPFALCTLYLSSSAVIYVDHGPFWLRAIRDEVSTCAKNWWRNILLVNTDIDTLCHIVTWYVSCDFQLAIYATFLFCLFRKNRKLGITAFVIFAIAVTLNLGFTVYWNNLDVLPFDLKTILLLRKNTTASYTYFKSFIRAGSYLVGMVMGYIVAIYKPGDHRNIISKKWSFITTVISLAMMFTVSLIGVIFSKRPYDPLEAAIVVATNRVVWAVAVCCIIGVCEYGNMSLVSDCLSWSGFVPLSKLSYCLYLLHPLIIQKYKYSSRSGATFGVFITILNSTGVIVIGYAMSLVLYLILEAPLNNISNTLFTQKSTSLETNGKNNPNKNVNYVSPQQNGQIKAKFS